MKESIDYSAKAAAWIQEHYREKYSAVRLADELFINKDYLERCFKKKTGDTLLRFHHKIRCEHARELLENQEYSVSMISDQVGYATVSHFIKVFKSIYGETPVSYRTRKLDITNSSVLEHYA